MFAQILSSTKCTDNYVKCLSLKSIFEKKCPGKMNTCITFLKPSKTYPLIPSSLRIRGNPSLSVEDHPGCVWILTLTASIGHRAMSAKNSADALATKYRDVLHKKAFS